MDPDLCQTLFQELQAILLKHNNHHPMPPEIGPSGNYAYQFSIENDGNYRIYQRTSLSSSSSLLEGKTTLQEVMRFDPEIEIHGMSLSVDESCIACLEENIVKQTKLIRIRNIETGQERFLSSIADKHDDDGPNIVSLEWGPVITTKKGYHHSIYLVGSDQQGRPDRVYVSTVDPKSLHQSSEFQILFQSNDPAVMVDAQRTKGCQYVAIQAMTKSSNEVYLSAGPSSLILVRPRQDNVLYHLDVGDQNDVVVLLSDEKGGELCMLETTVGLLPMDNNKEQRNNNKRANSDGGAADDDDDHVISDMDLFRDYHVLYERSTATGCQRIRVLHRQGSSRSASATVPISPEDMKCGKISPAGNIHFHSSSLRFLLESPIDPGCIYDFDFESNELKTVGATETPKGKYVRERIFVPSKDGTPVPLSIVFREDEESWPSWFNARERNPRPVVLVGYGAYGEPMDLGYEPTWLPLLSRGFVLAFAHTRGGGDLGKAWYHAGCRENKINAIEDFEACANHLKTQWTGPLTAKAFSAGGVLVGAALNRQPGLFDNVVLTNAFVDVYNTMMDPNLFLTPHEWDEYGNPLEDANIHDLIQSYCPIYNASLSSNPIPRILLIGTLDDDNVPFWNATILGKKLRDCTEDKDNVLLHIEDSGGHHLGSRRPNIAALELAFIIQNST